MTAVAQPIIGRKGDEVGMVDEFRALTYAEADQRVNQAIHAFRSLGLQKQDCIATLSGNRSEFCTTWAATQSAEWCVVPINWHFSPEEVAYVLGNCGARVLAADADFADLAFGGRRDRRHRPAGGMGWSG